MQESYLDSLYWVPLVALLLLLVGCALMRPRAAFALLFATTPLFWGFGAVNPLQFGGLELKPPVLTGGVVTLLSVLLALRSRVLPGLRALQRAVWVLMVVSVPSIFSAPNLADGVGGYLRVLSPWVVMLAVLPWATGMHRVATYLRAMAWSLGSMTLVVLVAKLEGQLYQTFGGLTRLGPLYIPAQQLSYYLTVMVAVGLLGYSVLGRLPYLLVVGLAAAGAYLTQVRTSWIAITLLLFVSAFSSPRRLPQAAILLVGAALAVPKAPDIWAKLLRYSSNIESLQSADKVLSGRITVNSIVLEHYLRAPLWNKLFGIGVGQSLEVSRQAGLDLYVHNDYLAAVVEMGAISALGYGLILSAILKLALQGAKRGRGRSVRVLSSVYLRFLGVFAVMGLVGVWYGNVFAGWYASGLTAVVLAQSALQYTSQPEQAHECRGPNEIVDHRRLRF